MELVYEKPNHVIYLDSSKIILLTVSMPYALCPMLLMVPDWAKMDVVVIRERRRVVNLFIGGYVLRAGKQCF